MGSSEFAVCANTVVNISFFVLLLLFLLGSLFLGCWLRGKYAEEQQSEYSSEQRTIFPFHLKILACFVGAQIISSGLGLTGALLIRPPTCDSLECKTSNFRSGAILIGLGFGIDNILIGMRNNK
jgi:hypothetical protein